MLNVLCSRTSDLWQRFLQFFVALFMAVVLSGSPVAADGLLVFDVTRDATGGTIGVLNMPGDDLCPDMTTRGCDYDQDDDFVRTNDGVAYGFAVQVDPPGDNVYIEAELKPGMVWDQLPGICNAATSTITGDGTAVSPSTIFCDLGFRSSFAANITFVARALGSNPDGATSGLAFAQFYGDDCDPIVDDLVGVEDVEITAKPQYNIRKEVNTRRPGNIGGVDGYIIDYRFFVETWKTNTNGDPTDDPDPLFGVETGVGPITFTEDASGVSTNAYIVSCSQPGYSAFPLTSLSGATPERSVLDAGTVSCAATGPGTSSTTVTVTGADLSLSHYPTQTRTGGAIAGDRRIASFGAVRVFIPLTDITAAGGTLSTTNSFGDVNVMSITGQQNFAGAPQDGNGGEASSDNSVSATVIEGSGNFSHTYRCAHPSRSGTVGCNPYWYSPPTTATGNWAGDGAAEPTQELATYSAFTNQRFTPVTDATVCSIFDSRYVEPIPYGTADHSTSCSGQCGVEGVDYVIEYAVDYVSTTWQDMDPIPSGAVQAECQAATTWYTTLSSAQAAGDITKTRIRRLTPLNAGQGHRAITALQVRSIPDLASVPSSTLLKTWGTAETSGYFPGTMRDCAYSSGLHPLPGQVPNSCGDRVFLNRALARIEKYTVPGNLINTIDAGGRVTFELVPSFTALNPLTENVTIVDMIPVGGIYVPGTSFQDGLSFEPVVTGTPSTGQTLTWDLGILTTNDPIDPISFEMRTPLTTPNGTNLDNVARVDTPADDSTDEQRSATRRVTVTAPASMLMAKQVTPPLIAPGGSYTYTIEYLNTTGFPFNEMDVIDVLPYDADGRFPPSDFFGGLTLTSMVPESTVVQVYYSMDAPGGIVTDPNLAANDFATGANNWCPAGPGFAVDPGASPTNGGASSLCPADGSEVTAFRIFDTEPLAPASIRNVMFTVLTTDNFGGDSYTNQAQGTSDGITLSPLTPYVVSRVIDEPAIGTAKEVVSVVDNLVTFNIRIENLGNSPLSNVSLVDDLDATFGTGNYTLAVPPAFDIPDASATLVLNSDYSGTGSETNLLDPASVLGVGEFAIVAVQVQIDEVTDQGNGLGVYENTATAEGTSPSGIDVKDLSNDGDDPDPDNNGSSDDPDEDTPTPITAEVLPNLEVVKSSSSALLSDPIVVGDQIEYTFEITNTGNVALENVTLTDPLFDPDDITSSCTFPDGAGNIPFEGSVTCTALYSITADDLDNAGVDNQAVAAGEGGGIPTEDDSDSGNPGDDTGADDDETTTPLWVPGIQVEKVDVAMFSSPVAEYDTITFTIQVTNIGNIELTGVALVDTLTNGDGTALSYDAPGLTWQSSTLGSTAGTLQVDEVGTYVAVYTLTQDDIDSGEIVNTATATGNNATGTPVSDMSDDPSDPTDTLDNGDPADPNVTPLLPDPMMTLTKSVEAALDTNEDGLYGGEGDEIIYKFTVRNTGNVRLTGITVTDPLVVMSGGPIDLGPGDSDSTTFTGSYFVLPTDVSQGYIENTARADGFDPEGGDVMDISDTGTDPDVDPVVDPENTETPDADGSTDGDSTNDPTILSVPSNAKPEIELVKSISMVADVNGNDLTDAGDLVTYVFTVRNTGNTILGNVTVTDPLLEVSGGPITLAVGASDSATFMGTYTLTAADVAAGGVENTAIATGASVNSLGEPIIDLETGEQFSTDDTSDTGTEPDLGPDGQPVDVADPAGTESPDLGGGTDVDPGNDPTVLFIPQPSIMLEKFLAGANDTNGDGLFGGVGDVLTYRFVVTNTGNTALADITVSDPIAVVSGGPISLPVGGMNETAFTATYIVQAADISRGYVENSATVDGTAVDGVGEPYYGPTGVPLTVTDVSDTGTAENGTAVTDPENEETPDGSGGTDADPTNDPTVTMVPLNPEPGVSIVKSAVGSEDTNGDEVEGGFDDLMFYEFAVTNTGNYPLSNVVVNDPLLGGDVATIPTIQVGETIVVTGEYLITFDDYLARQIENQATASGSLITPAGDPILDPVTGEPLVAEDDSDTGTGTGLEDINDPESVETADGGGSTDGDPTNDPTLTTIPTQPSNAGVSGTVYLDVNDDGNLDGSDEVLGGYVVTLFDDQGRILGTATTNADGTYEIVGFPIGSGYTLVFTDPSTGEEIGQIDDLSFGPDTFLTEQDARIINESPADIRVTKVANRERVVLGDVVQYTISVANVGAGPANGMTVTDTLPSGLGYIPGTAVVDGAANEPTISGRTQSWTGIDIAPGGTIVVLLTVSVQANAPFGEMTNTAGVIDPASGETVAESSATITRLPEHVFDCSDVIGKVFDDRNYNGYQDDVSTVPAPITQTIIDPETGKFDVIEETQYLGPENGMPNVRLVTPTGTIITTDAQGRYSVPCAELAQTSGTNFTLKLDPRSLPTGYRMTTENPRTLRLTPGIMTEMNFGVAIGRVVDVDLTANAFAGDEPVAQLNTGIRQLLGQISDTPSLIRLSYFSNGEDPDLVRDRLEAVEDLILQQWRNIGRYRLIIERSVKFMQ